MLFLQYWILGELSPVLLSDVVRFGNISLEHFGRHITGKNAYEHEYGFVESADLPHQIEDLN